MIGARMPDPVDLDHPDWEKLSGFAYERVTARFDQEKCFSTHGIDEQSACVGLSLQWLQMIDGRGITSGGAQERLTRLASFDNTVHARIAHGLYRAEHHHAHNDAIQDDEDAVGNAGEFSILQAAGMKGLRLDWRPGTGGRSIEDAAHLMADAGRGVLVLESGSEAHAIAFADVGYGRMITFDPALGEFEVAHGELAPMVDEMANHRPLTKVEVLALR